ncbi:MAG: hypothetical protein AABX00_01150 [Nanoarchaeota archaeon]
MVDISGIHETVQSPQPSDESIAKALIGKRATLKVKEAFNPDLVENKGIVMDISPRYFVNLAGGHSVFAGHGTGIFQIFDSDGNLVYRNDAVLTAYTSPVKDAAKRDEIRQQGQFFP